MKILACADIHIGRIPSVPGRTGISGRSAWEAVVDKAIELKVDALVLAGDVVEYDNAWFEAYGALIKGLGKLASTGIKVFAVAGNHDAEVFARIAAKSDDIRLLGMNGTWEKVEFQEVTILGWSFPKPNCLSNPFDSFPSEMKAISGPVLGLLHCDLNGAKANSHYAPVPEDVLKNSTVPLWVLGHIHKPILDQEQGYFYCGSPFSLDSGEQGAHGIWLLENTNGRNWNRTFIPLSPWRFDVCTVRLPDGRDGDGVLNDIADSMRRLAEKLIADGFIGEAYCRLSFQGNLSCSVNLTRLLPMEKLSELVITLHDVTVTALETFDDNTLPEIDIDSLEKGSGPAALLARQLKNMDTLPGLTQEVLRIEKESWDSAAYRNLEKSGAPINPEDILRLAGNRLLRAMLEQEGSRE